MSDDRIPVAVCTEYLGYSKLFVVRIMNAVHAICAPVSCHPLVRVLSSLRSYGNNFLGSLERHFYPLVTVVYSSGPCSYESCLSFVIESGSPCSMVSVPFRGSPDLLIFYATALHSKGFETRLDDPGSASIETNSHGDMSVPGHHENSKVARPDCWTQFMGNDGVPITVAAEYLYASSLLVRRKSHTIVTVVKFETCNPLVGILPSLCPNHCDKSRCPQVEL